jgi:hypothetical protein
MVMRGRLFHHLYEALEFSKITRMIFGYTDGVSMLCHDRLTTMGNDARMPYSRTALQEVSRAVDTIGAKTLFLVQSQ